MANRRNFSRSKLAAKSAAGGGCSLPSEPPAPAGGPVGGESADRVLDPPMMLSMLNADLVTGGADFFSGVEVAAGTGTGLITGEWNGVKSAD